MSQEKSKSLSPFLAYRGGKSRTAKIITKTFPKHEKFVEPMVGGGSVLFAKQPTDCDESSCEVISDVDKALMTFYKSLKKGNVTRCDLTPNRRRLEKIKNKRRNSNDLTACEYLYLNKLSFGGTGTSFSKARFEKCKNDKKCGVKSKNIPEYEKRLKKVKIETGDFQKTIQKHDSKNTLFYIDPPYAGTNRSGYVDKSLQPEQVKQVVDKIKGKFALSYNNTKTVRKTFCRSKKYKCRKIKTTYTMGTEGKHKKTNELLITNY